MDDDITVLILSIFWLRTMQSITQAQDFHKAKFFIKLSFRMMNLIKSKLIVNYFERKVKTVNYKIGCF